MKRIKKTKAILVGSAVALLLSACSVAPVTEEVSEVVPVRVEQVVKGDFTKQNEIVAHTKLSSEVHVVPKTAGELTELLVKKGDIVEAGQQLAFIDDVDVRRALELERMSLDLARHQLEAAQIQYRQVEESVKSMLRTETEVPDEVEDRVRQASLQVEQAQLSIRQSEIRLQQAEERLQDSAIKSPIQGEIVNIAASVGEMVGQSVLFTVVQLDPMKLEAGVSSNQLAVLEKGQKIAFEISSDRTQHEGIITFISPVADPSGLFAIELETDNSDRSLRAGSSARLFIPETLVEDALVVPTEAVVSRSGEDIVFVVKDGIATQVNVEILNTQTDQTAVRGELSEQDHVVVRGQLTLNDGLQVRIVEEGQ